MKEATDPAKHKEKKETEKTEKKDTEKKEIEQQAATRVSSERKHSFGSMWRCISHEAQAGGFKKAHDLCVWVGFSKSRQSWFLR